MKSFRIYYFVLYFVLLISLSCTDRTIVNRTPKTPSETSIFIWDTMYKYYLWKDQVNPLEIRRESGQWYSYLNMYDGKNKELFNDILYKENNKLIDKWSQIIEDYDEYETSLNRPYKNFGFEFEIIKKGKVYGIVLYVTPNGVAEEAGIKRGDTFDKVNGQTLTMENYKDLLLEQDNCEINITQPLPKNVQLTATTKTAPPILKVRAYEVDGKNVGYILYNYFPGTDEHHKELNARILQLKNTGIKELILDLRYNGGGSVYNASLLASMLVKKEHIGQVFDRREYNKALTAELSTNDDLLFDKITDKILDVETMKKELEKIYSLELDRIFILTSNRTASASELLINGLSPYMQVVLIGSQTYGKYVGSATILKDVDEQRTVNPNHKWALNPIIMKFFNAKGVGNYKDGFKPNYHREEHDVFPQYLPLGDSKEFMLKTALDIISGKTVDPDSYASTRAKSINVSKSSVDYQPFSHKAHDERISIKLNNK